MWVLFWWWNVCFFVFLGVCFHKRCLGTWEQNLSLCNVLEASWIFILSSSWSPHKSSDVLLCWFAWFLRELHQNTLKLLCFGKNRITYSYIENIHHSQLSHRLVYMLCSRHDSICMWYQVLDVRVMLLIDPSTYSPHIWILWNYVTKLIYISSFLRLMNACTSSINSTMHITKTHHYIIHNII